MAATAQMDVQGNESILSGDVILTDCNSSSLLIPFLRVSNLVGGVDEERNNPFLDLMAFHDGPSSIHHFVHEHLPKYTRQSPRRSPRFKQTLEQVESPMFSETSVPVAEEQRAIAPLPKRVLKSNKAERVAGGLHVRPKITDTRTLKFLDETGEVRHSNHQWSFGSALETLDFDDPSSSKPASSFSAPFIFGASSQPMEPVLKKRKHAKRSVNSAANRQRGGQAKKNKDGFTNPVRDVVLFHRTVKNSDVATSSTFSLLHDATVAGPGFSGRKLPALAYQELVAKYFEKDDAEALYPWIREFLAVPYTAGRGTFILDNGGRVFAYRSWAALWMEDRVAEIEEAQEVLCGKDLKNENIRVKCANRSRGPHLPIIIGHHRQSQQKPELTKWHRDNNEAVDKFLSMKIIKDIVGWVTSIIRIVFPGVAARIEADVKWHLEKYGIKPLFGFYWNFCWNAVFPGQDRIHTPPHIDWKNQIVGCSILTYLTSLGVKVFNHKYRTWLVLWEMSLYLELAPWTLTTYPSAIFFHYNIDIHRLGIVSTPANVDIPTPENSEPLARDGDQVGRGSMVFFNQGTMRMGPAVNHNTLKEAIAAGHSGKTDWGADINAAFRKAVVTRPLPQEIIDQFCSTPHPDFSNLHLDNM
ncbi:hypothetical protein R3P38DRAFT_3175279 [Favolaschia claudopus]|uniref:Uncharacterized protein n=1 Tax=Favolaschia claudopus TaxID=2862362 RepID=A0AAW0DF96_9AGAR